MVQIEKAKWLNSRGTLLPLRKYHRHVRFVTVPVFWKAWYVRVQRAHQDGSADRMGRLEAALIPAGVQMAGAHYRTVWYGAPISGPRPLLTKHLHALPVSHYQESMGGFSRVAHGGFL